jgi:hypothetical protein
MATDQDVLADQARADIARLQVLPLFSWGEACPKCGIVPTSWTHPEIKILVDPDTGSVIDYLRIKCTCGWTAWRKPLDSAK